MNQAISAKYNTKGFTPQRQNLPAVDVSNQIMCGLIGPGYERPTELYVKPEKLADTYKKWTERGVKMIIPIWAQVQYAEQFEALVSSEPEPELITIPIAVEEPIAADRVGERRTARPVICLNTGTFYPSVKKAAFNNKISPELLGAHLRGEIKSAKGHRMRLATAAEVVEQSMNPTWRYAGELLPILPGYGKKQR